MLRLFPQRAWHKGCTRSASVEQTVCAIPLQVNQAANANSSRRTVQTDQGFADGLAKEQRPSRPGKTSRCRRLHDHVYLLAGLLAADGDIGRAFSSQGVGWGARRRSNWTARDAANPVKRDPTRSPPQENDWIVFTRPGKAEGPPHSPPFLGTRSQRWIQRCVARQAVTSASTITSGRVSDR
jgi:hypothetical protein